MTIDDFIMTESSDSWRKVALIVGRALTSPELSKSAAFGADEIFERVLALVANGALESAGDISDWRHSEIRRAQQTNPADA